MDTFELLSTLSETPGPSGNEGQVAEVVREIWRPLVDSTYVDRIGSVIARKNGEGSAPRYSIMIACHMDEIGLMVKEIVPLSGRDQGAGFLRVARVGGVDSRQLLSQRVTIHGTGTKGRELFGVIGALPRWLTDSGDNRKAYKIDDYVIDTGLDIESLREIVRVGDFVSFRQPVRKLQNKRVTGKALDNRVSVVAVTWALEYLGKQRHEWDVYAVATAQEETALLGAYTSAFSLEPDVAVAIDVTFGKGPGASDALTYDLAGGPTVGLGPNVHPGITQSLMSASEALEMKTTLEPHSRPGGTDAYGLQIARAGIPTGLVSIPLRYMHTMVETVAMKDIERCGRLLAEFVARLDDDFLSSIATEFLDD